MKVSPVSFPWKAAMRFRIKLLKSLQFILRNTTDHLFQHCCLQKNANRINKWEKKPESYSCFLSSALSRLPKIYLCQAKFHLNELSVKCNEAKHHEFEAAQNCLLERCYLNVALEHNIKRPQSVGGIVGGKHSRSWSYDGFALSVHIYHICLLHTWFTVFVNRCNLSEVSCDLIIHINKFTVNICNKQSKS